MSEVLGQVQRGLRERASGPQLLDPSAATDVYLIACPRCVEEQVPVEERDALAYLGSGCADGGRQHAGARRAGGQPLDDVQPELVDGDPHETRGVLQQDALAGSVGADVVPQGRDSRRAW